MRFATLFATLRPTLRPTLRALVLLALALPIGTPVHAATSRRAALPAVALPDTGLFAPVASQQRARLARLATLGTTAGAERVRLLGASGRLDQAARVAAALDVAAPEVAQARARVALARQDFAGFDAIAARLGDDAAGRSLHYAWLVVRDDAAALDSLTRLRVAGAADADAAPELLAAGRGAYERLDYPRAESLFTRALAATPASASRPAWGDAASASRARARTGLALVQQKRREWDASLATLRQALDDDATADVLMALTETLIRLGRTDEAISAAEWAVALAPYHDAAHYLLGNGYARKNYTQLAAAYPRAFADAAGARALAAADARLAEGRRADARAAYARVIAAHPGWVDARVRLASLDFEDARFAEARDGCFAALRVCPEYGRAHAVLAKALESQRFEIDVHRPDYEARFAASPTPELPGIERFVVNWRALSPRHQKRVALSVAPWKAFLPVLIEGGATYFIKPLWMKLSECPDIETLRDQRINYDSRLWDDVRGCGGYHTVTGLEDVERTIFDRYNTVLHELTHQVHAVLPADDSRAIQEHYRQAKERDDATREGFLSRYAGGSVYEYFAEGANAIESPRRDRFDPREIVRERLERMDPALHVLVLDLMKRTDVSSSWPVAFAAGGDDRVERGRIAEAVPLYERALARDPGNETAMLSYSRALLLGGFAARAESVAVVASAAHATSGAVWVQRAEAEWHAGRGAAAALAALESRRAGVRATDRWLADAQRSRLAWVAGDATTALAAADSVLAYQSDNPEGQQSRAAALALAKRWDDAFAQYEAAVRMRTGVAELRNAYARDLLRAGRIADARAQLDAAKLLDEENATSEALRAWADLAEGRVALAAASAKRALAWNPRCDLAQVVAGAVARRSGRAAGANAAWADVERRIAGNAPPAWIYRPKLATWEQVGALPAVEREVFDTLRR